MRDHMMRGFWYLATPYAEFPGGHDAAWKFATKQAALCLEAGVRVFTPIGHTHPIAIQMKADPGHDFWLELDEHVMDAADGLIVVEAEGWERSLGIAREIGFFRGRRKSIVYMAPDIPPTPQEFEEAEQAADD